MNSQFFKDIQNQLFVAESIRKELSEHIIGEEDFKEWVKNNIETIRKFIEEIKK